MEIILLDDMKWADRPNEDEHLYDTCYVYENPELLCEAMETLDVIDITELDTETVESIDFDSLGELTCPRSTLS